MAKKDTVRHYFTDRDRFIGGVLRKANDPEGFALQPKDIPKKLPKGMRLLTGMTPAQKEANDKKKAEKAKELKEQDKEFAAVGAGTGAPDFMDTDKLFPNGKPNQGKVTTI